MQELRMGAAHKGSHRVQCEGAAWLSLRCRDLKDTQIRAHTCRSRVQDSQERDTQYQLRKPASSLFCLCIFLLILTLGDTEAT